MDNLNAEKRKKSKAVFSLPIMYRSERKRKKVKVQMMNKLR